MTDPNDIEVDETDRAEQLAPADPSEDAPAPEGGPDLVDEADWIDQNTDASQDDEDGSETLH